MSQIFRDPERFGKIWSLVIALLTALLTVGLSPLGLDIPIGTYVALVAFAVFGVWFIWTIPSLQQFFKIGITIVIIGGAFFLGYFVFVQAAQPRFDIAALRTLEGDANAYEVTDMLIWNSNIQDQYGVAITFTLEIVPKYFGQQKFGRVIALISGDSDTPPLEKPLWDGFTSAANPKSIDLTLPEVLAVSGLQDNSDPPHNTFGPGDSPFQQTKLKVQIVQEADKTHAWSTQEITLRNAPWEMRGDLVWRDNQRQADVYVKNLGGAGEFTFRYYLVQMDQPVDTTSSPSTSGITKIKSGNEPDKLVKLAKGEFFTHTISLPDLSVPGHYLVEIFAVKKQNYVQFTDPTASWEKSDSMRSPWWFGQIPPIRLTFVVPLPEFEVNPIIQAELDRVKKEQGVDLGLAIGPAEEVSSGAGTKGWRQTFRGGEVYLYNDQAYALYDPILTHFKQLGGIQYEMGFPISPMQTITSSSGLTATMMKFEGKNSLQPSAVIYASKKGVVGTWGWIGKVHSQNGGSAGWLGLPLADEQYFTDSTIQMFEYGYIIYQFPYVGKERDWGRPPIAYPYLTSRGTLFDVQAPEIWQDTGVHVQAGDRLTIIQVGGGWTYYSDSGEELFDANGDIKGGLVEYRTLPSAFPGTLIGRIGEDGSQVFPAGRWSVRKAPAEGTLYLAMNDSEYKDNSGFITVQIMVEPSK